MFTKILVANRGEIACRVIRTARRMGITTVAVYSEADRTALHVEMADETVHIGEGPSSQSYLCAERIVEVCRQSGAEAVHPGYGFLSENAGFAAALDAAGIVFIGPGRSAIEAMGDKITSKRIAGEAGVNVIPGSTEIVRDAAHAVEIAADIGFPVMLKASAGGGGKGMRIARDEAECRDGFERATSEARSSFGDARVFIEKFIEQPRHIEIQVIADAHGNVIHLGERECSIQRRHQKVIEEAPSPFIDAKTRRAMGEQAIALAKAVGYRSAGTVEFVVDADRGFYFLEMNTRLQVEHPVTEEVTGLDLVEVMIRIAAGEPLPLTQKDVRLDGWAIECRVYAEDPLRGFVPSTGRIVRYRAPETVAGVRVDSGVYEGSDVPMFYDPMLAKLIARGADRASAIATLRAALDAYCIRGIQTNLAFLGVVTAHPRFVAGELTTHFIDEAFADGFGPEHLRIADSTPLIVVAAAVHRMHRQHAATISGQMPGQRPHVPDDWVAIVDGEHRPCTVRARDGVYDVVLGGVEYSVHGDWRFGEPLFEATINGEHRCVQVDRSGLGYRLAHGGAVAEILLLSPREAELASLMPEKTESDLSGFLLSPMPGLLLSLAVEEGDEVKAGQELAVVEAMKMENVLRADRDRIVKAVLARPGDSLGVDQKIVEFE